MPSNAEVLAAPPVSMPGWTDGAPLERKFEILARACAVGLMIGNALVLSGWLSGVAWLTNFGTHAAMAPNTALAFLLAGTSLWLAGARPQRVRGRISGTACALAVLLIGALTAAEYAFGIDLGIDQILARDAFGLVRTGFPGRMAVITCLLLMVLGAALCALHIDSRRSGLMVQTLSGCMAIAALVGLLGYAYGELARTIVYPFGGIALHTVVSFLMAAAGIAGISLRHGKGIIIMAPGVGGILARRLLPWAVIVPPLIGWLRLEGQEAGYYGTEFGAALTVVSTIVIFVALLVTTARSLEDFDRARMAADAALRSSEAMLRQTQAVSGVGGWEYDVAAGRISWTEEVYRIHELPFDFDPGSASRDIEFYRGADRGRIARAFQAACEKGQPYDLELEFTTAKGRHRWVRALGRPEVRDGRVARVYGYIVDITERKQAESEIRTLNATLEQRVKERTLALEAANRELEAFAYSVSHDLRAPLRSIDGFSQVLLEDYGPKFDEEGRDSLRRVREATQRMGQLIDDMLKLSRATRGELEIGPVDLSALAESTIAGLRSAAPERTVSVVIAPGVAGRGDARLLGAVIENLLSNAWKFTLKTDAARIEFGAEQKDGELVCHVRDNGAGFDMAYVDNLFGPFQRLHQASEFPGNGIGLATVKRIISRLGGRVWAEGAVGKGATFYFTLPVA